MPGQLRRRCSGGFDDVLENRGEGRIYKRELGDLRVASISTKNVVLTLSNMADRVRSAWVGAMFAMCVKSRRRKSVQYDEP
nr:unnamed protein product [Callosobruchus analis]